jgi:PPOX class probable F420-dependent enzyme
MPIPIPPQYCDLFERPVVVTLVTMMPDGQPQATPVWCSYDGTHIWVNSARGRQKDLNMVANPRVTILAIDPDNTHRWVEIRGRVDEITEQGALDHRNALAKKYMGRDHYYSSTADQGGQEIRVIYKIKPEKVNAQG